MNNLPPKFLQKPPPYFFMVHLLHRLYGVDAPGYHSGTRDSKLLLRVWQVIGYRTQLTERIDSFITATTFCGTG